GLTDVALSPDGTLIALARVWNTVNEEKGRLFRVSEAEVCDAATGRRVHHLDRTELPWDDQGKTLWWLKRVAFSPDGRRLAVIDANDLSFGPRSLPPAAARIYDLASGTQVMMLGEAGERCAFSPDGQWIATLILARKGEGWDGALVRLWDARTGTAAGTYRPR